MTRQEIASRRALRASSARIGLDKMTAAELCQMVATLGIIDAHSWSTRGVWTTRFLVEFDGGYSIIRGEGPTLTASMHAALGQVGDYYAAQAVREVA